MLKDKISKLLMFYEDMKRNVPFVPQRVRKDIDKMKKLRDGFHLVSRGANDDAWVDKHFYQMRRHWSLFTKQLDQGSPVKFYDTYYIKYQLKKKGMFTPVCVAVCTMDKNAITQEKLESSEFSPVYDLNDRLDILIDIETESAW